VVLEGIDGSGSTTQARRLVARLKSAGHDAVLTCEPSSGPVGTLIREALEHRLHGDAGAARSLAWTTLALLFAADRTDHLHATVLPALGRGATVVSDRYDLSSYAYQTASAGAPGAALAWIRELNRHAVRPDLTLVLDVSAEVAERRRNHRGQQAELFEVPELQRRLAASYARAEELVPGDRLLHIDGEAQVEEVEASIWSAVQALERKEA
jgi:dTMP kinase